MAHWKSNSQPKDDPYAVSLDRNNRQIQRAHAVKILLLLRLAWEYGGPILLNPGLPRGCE